MSDPANTPQEPPILAFSGSPEGSPLPQSEMVEGAAPLAIEELLWRLREGDRDAAAEFLMRYGARIRRRIRGKLGPNIRRVFDSMDIMSTLGRRLDLYVMSGRMNIVSEEQLWSLLFKMADHALVDKARIIRSMNSIENQDSEFTHAFARRQRASDRSGAAESDLEIENCLHLLQNETDRRFLSMWVMGESFSSIGRRLELSPEATRKKWERIRTQLKQHFRNDSGDRTSGPDGK